MFARHNPAWCWAFLYRARRLSTPMAVRFTAAAISFMVMLFWARTAAVASEAVSQEEPTTVSVEESVSSIERSFVEKEARPGFFPWLKEQVKDADPFFRDTKLDVNLRTYYFYRDNYPNTTPQTNEAWAIGGALCLQVGMVSQPFRNRGGRLYTLRAALCAGRP